MLISGASLNEIYVQMLREIMFFGRKTSPRSNPTVELAPCIVCLKNPNSNIITIDYLRTNLEYAKAEFDWYLKGSNKIKDIKGFEAVWEKYSDDGKTVNSAYGYNIFGNNPEVGINQWHWVIQKLKEDPDSRQAVININLPYHKKTATKDFPCTVFLQYLIRDGKLYAYTYMRSNDVYYGFRNDIYCFTELQKFLAKVLEIPVGEYWHFATSMHIYEKDLEKIKKALNNF